MAVSKLRKSKKTIMVVDDNPDLGTIIQTMLEVKGFEVQPAYNGVEFYCAGGRCHKFSALRCATACATSNGSSLRTLRHNTT